MGEILLAIIPGTDALKLGIALATGADFTWEDLASAALDLIPGGGSAQLIAKASAAFVVTKIGVKAGKAVGKLVGHHTVPVAVLKRLKSEVANHPLVRGKKGAPNIWDIPEDFHKVIHGNGALGGQWNQRWYQELERVGGPEVAEVEDVLQIRELLIREFRLEGYRP